MISLEFLESVEAFEGLSKDQLAAIQQCAELVDYNKGDRLFIEGDDSTFLWVVVEGEVELRSETEGPGAGDADRISFMSAAHAFGWTCFVPPYKYRLSGYCASERCKALRFKKQDLEKLFAADPEIGSKVMFYLILTVGTHFQELQDERAQHWGHEIMNRW